MREQNWKKEELMEQSPQLKPIYNRVILKLTGQVFSGSDSLFNSPRIGKIAEEIKTVSEHDVKIIIVVGGGNIFRGRDVQIPGFNRNRADWMGMLATVMNAIFLEQIMALQDIKVKVFSAIRMDEVTGYYTLEKLDAALKKNEGVIIIGGGLGKPYCSTDYASMVYAIDLNTEAILKGTKVDGLFDKDPKTNKKAKLIPEISYKKAIQLELEKIMDTSALGLAIDRKENLPIHIFNIFEKGNLWRLFQGEKIGSKIVP
jgi:uridylate kinase